MDAMESHIVVIAELRGNQVIPVTYELLDLAEEIGRVHSLPVKVLLLGTDVERPAREIADASGNAVLAIRNRHLQIYNGEVYKDILEDILPPLNPAFILIAQTTQGLDFGPGLAVRFGAACITGVNAFVEKEEGFCFSRAAFNGKIVTHLLLVAKTAVLLVQPGAFEGLVRKAQNSGPIEIKISNVEAKRMRSVGVTQSRPGDAGLAGADVVVAAGRGVGEKENMTLIQQLSTLFPRSAVAGSRPVCDMGWLEYRRQVGLTGATVSPDLYIACGISGAVPHQVGMQGSGFIVAISTDPRASIFNIADVCIQDDLKRFIPAVMEEFEKRKRQRGEA